MKKVGLFIATLLVAGTCFSQPSKTIARPQLVVGLVVDQMRWDYLYRYYDRYGNDGFKRLLQQGYSCENTMINYLPSYTAPGHACIYTGSVPSIHGIAGNDWIENTTGKHRYCVEDADVLPVGGSMAAGKMSPKNLLTTTVTDELRLATQFQSKVVGISLKDRGSILPAGHLGKAYWYDDSTGNFITSNYYENELPQWLQEFNKRKLAKTYISTAWETLYPLASYTQSLPDNNPFEGKLKGETAPIFPHVFNTNSHKDIRKTPLGNTFTLDMAKAAISGEQLGKKHTDFLCISLSATDYIGHNYAPNSIEVEDTYLRLDKDIASFLKHLDQTIGKGNYLFFLTADHGAAHNADYLNSLNIPAGNESERELGKQINSYVEQKTGQARLIRGVENYQVVLNDSAIRHSKMNRQDVKVLVQEYLLQKPQVAYVLDMENLSTAAVPELIKQKAIHGYHRNRSGDMLIINHPGWYYGYGNTGTTHSTWHPYDTHIPLLFFGWKVTPGKTNRTVHLEDIAPTLAALLHIQMPNGCMGNVITEVIP